MVRSKEVPKKPKDPLLTPPSKRWGSLRDDDRGGSLPWNRGAAAMSPVPASVPNYMRGTSSSDAKAGQRAGVPASASPTRRRPIQMATRGKVLFPDVPGMVRATCSSTLKEAKFPSALDLAPGATDAEGPAALRVCPYTYCSLNGHAHAPAVPLRSFLASRRRLIKTQQNMKLKGVSAFRKGTDHQRPEDQNGAGVCGGAKVAPLIDEEALGDYFVEVYTGPRVSSDMSCSDMSLDEMDATVRRMEFVVFDRCGGDEDNDKGDDLGVCGEGEQRLENRLAVCRESSSECSDADAAITGNLVEELPWLRYQGYEYDSLDDEVSEGQGVVDEEIGGSKVSEEQEDKDELRTSGDLRKEEADEEMVPKNILDLPCETGIIAEEEGVDCRVEACEDGEGKDECNNILQTMFQHEASIGEEMQHPRDGEESTVDLTRKMEVTIEQTGALCMVEVCKEQEERDADDILDKVCQGNTSDGQGTSEEKLFEGVSESGIPEHEVVGKVENILEDDCKEDNSVNQDTKADASNVESAGKLIVTEVGDMMNEENMLDDVSEMEISESVSCVAQKEDFFEEEVTSEVVSECEISEFSAIGSPDVETLEQPTNDAFEQDVGTVEDAFEQDGSTMNNNAFEQHDIPAENAVDAAKDAFEQDVGTVEDVFEQDVSTMNKMLAFEHDIPAEKTVDAAKDAQKELEITACKLEDDSEEPGIAQESSQDVNSVCVDAAAEMEPEITKCKSEDSAEESGIAQEISQSDRSAYVTDASQIEPEYTTCKSGGAPEESGITQETVPDDKSAYLVEGAQMQLEIGTSELDDTSEESGIGHEIGEDNNSSYVSDDAQTCQSGDASEELVTVQEAHQDHKSADFSGDAQNETCELANASEESGNAQAIRDDKAANVTDGAQKESNFMASGSGHALEESDITQEGNVDDCAAGVIAGAQKESLTITCELEDGCEDACITEEANLSPIVKIDEQNGYGEPQNLPGKDTDTKEFSIDDMCTVFGELNLKGDVYLDPTETAIDPRNRLIIAKRRRTPEEEEYMRGFNPRAPNFLPLELDPDAEKVDLKHQMTEDRKNAEEWMIDYALRRAVNNLGPARKKKVELLVQAFETVVPHDEDGKKSITPTRHVQACN